MDFTMDLQTVRNQIQSVLTDDLLKSSYLKIQNRHSTTGHCYAASEAAMIILGGREKWMAVCGRDHTGGTHWWIKNKLTGDIFDVTSEQYTTFGFKPPYDNGKPCSFLTKEPSKRAKEILERLKKLS